jgi:hypothetical protein
VDLRLDYSLRVVPTMVSPLRIAVEQLLSVTGADEDLLHRATMTVHELLENVAKYSTDGQGRLLLEAAQLDGRERLVITVENTAAAGHLARVREWLSSLDGEVDSLEQRYRSLMVRSTSWSGSGLGLARIRAEAGMRITAYIVGDRVTLRAEVHTT